MEVIRRVIALMPELGLGPEGGKSATKPVQIMPLEDVDVIE
jgi:hypothetical protein